MTQATLVIHGGASDLTPAILDEAEGAERLATLHEALKQGFAILQAGGAALDAAIHAVTMLEDHPLFNAGKGSVLNTNGEAEMDAAVMDGLKGHCGGVGAVKTIKNPILAARAVMDRSPHSLLCATGAQDFAQSQGLEIVANSYFQTEMRRRELQKALDKKRFDPAAGLGTVGAVALDKHGHLAAATSTGGLTGKLPGRVSDSSIPGAGTWADKTCALSCTGTGDVFIANAATRDMAALIEYKGFSLAEAIRIGLDKVAAKNGSGGVIGIAKDGTIVMDYNTRAMFRGSISESQKSFAAVF